MHDRMSIAHEETTALHREIAALRSANQGLTQRIRDLASANANAAEFVAALEEAQERERRAIAEEHQAMTDELIRARDEALEGSRAKTAFLNNMNHELRTPLHTIIGYSDLLIEDCPNLTPEQITQDLKKVLAAGVHLLGLINDVLDLSRIEDGKMRLTATRFAVRPAIDAVVAAAQPLARERNNQLAVHCSQALGEMFNDEQRFRQVLSNLLSNAAKFTENGSITLHASTILRNEVPHLLVSIADTGIGIASAQMSHLFQPFAQADTSPTRRYGGNGLGLAISRRLCQMMGGEIQVASTPGSGSIFSVMIPGIAPAGPPATRTPSLPQHTAPTILAVLDPIASGHRVTGPLSLAGFRVITASCSDEAFALARAETPHLIAVDICTARPSGWEVVAALKADPALIHIPVVVTAFNSSFEQQLALRATDCFIKPVDWDRFEATLRGVVRDAPERRILVVDDDIDASDIARRLLEMEGWTVETAANGREALDRLSINLPALIIVDLVMPVMDGFCLVEHLQSTPQYWNIPTIVLSALSLTPEEHRRLNRRIPETQTDGVREPNLLTLVRRLLG